MANQNAVVSPVAVAALLTAPGLIKAGGKRPLVVWDETGVQKFTGIENASLASTPDEILAAIKGSSRVKTKRDVTIANADGTRGVQLGGTIPVDGGVLAAHTVFLMQAAADESDAS